MTQNSWPQIYVQNWPFTDFTLPANCVVCVEPGDLVGRSGVGPRPELERKQAMQTAPSAQRRILLFAVLLLAYQPCQGLSQALVAHRLLRHRVSRLAAAADASTAVRQSKICPIDVQIIQRQFASVRELPRVQRSTNNVTDATLLEIDDYTEPSFRRLFTHKTWDRYTGGSALKRMGRLLQNWNHCTVFSSVWPLILSVVLWSLLVPAILPSSVLSQLARGLGSTLQLQGTAIAFLLVFRTDNACARSPRVVREAWERFSC